MLRCDRQLHYQDDINLQQKNIWVNYIYTNIDLVSVFLLLYIIHILTLIFVLHDLKLYISCKQLSIHNIWNMSIIIIHSIHIFTIYKVLSLVGHSAAEKYISLNVYCRLVVHILSHER